MADRYPGVLKLSITVIALFVILWMMLYAALHYAYPLRFSGIVDKYSMEYRVDAALVYSVMKAESGFSEDAKSHKNAVGLMQITSDTGYWIADKMNIDDFILSDPETNIMFSCWYIRYLKDKFGEMETALAAYNAGEGNVSRWLCNPLYSSDGKKLSKIPYKETEKYVKTVMSDYNVYSKLY